MYANKAFDSYKIAWSEESTKYNEVYGAFFEAYFGLIKRNFKVGENKKVLEYTQLIQTSIQIWYGDSSKEEAIVKTIIAEVYQQEKKYNISDSLYVESLNIYKHCFKTKNIFYTTTLQFLANSYRDQHYYQNAIDLYQPIISLLQSDSTNYSSNENPEEVKYIINNTIASTYSEIAWTYSLLQKYDSADTFFNKAFTTTSFTKNSNYSKSLIRFAYHTLNKGNYYKAKEIMVKSLKVASNTYGKINHNYLFALEGLNSINTILAKYQEAEHECNNALIILGKITTQKNED